MKDILNGGRFYGPVLYSTLGESPKATELSKALRSPAVKNNNNKPIYLFIDKTLIAEPLY